MELTSLPTALWNLSAMTADRMTISSRTAKRCLQHRPNNCGCSGQLSIYCSGNGPCRRFCLSVAPVRRKGLRSLLSEVSVEFPFYTPSALLLLVFDAPLRIASLLQNERAQSATKSPLSRQPSSSSTTKGTGHKKESHESEG
ncbi:hypothetical protein BLNAU_14519 [Blattamonas nauphoetae]|uniref:Uncharacterized protein n=1 Tax=Blattamonas nauphoetae TaxID=2049346 RepID=A0ABQ9XGI0_9EUKA|nr:hypothetical protein BLNAU_14519 [Blattamonas nauphoetae]